MTLSGALEKGFRDAVFTAAKLFPANATTNSAAGVTDLDGIAPVLERMEALGMPLLIHGESISRSIFLTVRRCSSSV